MSAAESTTVHRLADDHQLVQLAEEAWPLDFEGAITVIPGQFGGVLVHGANGLLLHAPNLERAEAAIRALVGQPPPWVAELADQWRCDAREARNVDRDFATTETFQQCARELLEAAKAGAQ